jgi:hypothetical protein
MQQLLLGQHSQGVNSINVVSLITDLLHAYGSLVRTRQCAGGFNAGVSTSSNKFPSYALAALQREFQELEVINEVQQLLTELVSGPNKANQDALMALNVCEPIFAILQYLGPHIAGSHLTTVMHAQDVFSRWMDEFQVEDAGRVCVQRNGGDDVGEMLVIDHAGLADAWTSLQLLDDMEAVNDACESNIAQALLALVEGRDSSDPIFDNICVQLFPNVARGESLTVANSVLLQKLDTQYKISLTSVDEPDELLDGPTASNTTIQYHILLATLTASQEYGARIRDALDEWDEESNFPLARRIGRLELLSDGVVSVAYFPIPSIVINTRTSTVLQEVKKDVLESTYLMTDSERVHGARFSTEMYTRGCHWFPRLLASSRRVTNGIHLGCPFI